MKIITLNAWCGRVSPDIHNFFEKYKDIDIFCLQEVDYDGTRFGADVTGNNPEAGDPHLFKSIQNILTKHHGYFSPTLGSWWGNALFIKNELYRNMTSYGELLVSDDQQQYVSYGTWFRRSLQWIDFSSDGRLYTVINYHGLWEKDKGKEDSPDRITQSNKILEFLETKKDRIVILVGDFNLSPNTQSLHILESFPLRNLVKKYDISDTRTSYYKKENRFADYMLVDPSLKIKNFIVLPDEVSDHAPLLLEL